jgi:hypothetical protein
VFDTSGLFCGDHNKFFRVIYSNIEHSIMEPGKIWLCMPGGSCFFTTSIKGGEKKHTTVMKNPALNQFKLLVIGKEKDDNLVATNNKAMLEMFDKYGIKYRLKNCRAPTHLFYPQVFSGIYTYVVSLNGNIVYEKNLYHSF